MKCKVCKTDRKGDWKYSYYKFPKSPARRQEWIRLLNIKTSIKKHTAVCGRHFPTDQFIRTKLKKDALPRNHQIVTQQDKHLTLPENNIVIAPENKNQLTAPTYLSTGSCSKSLLLHEEKIKDLSRKLQNCRKKLKRRDCKLKKLVNQRKEASPTKSRRIKSSKNRRYTTTEKADALKIYHSCGQNGYRNLLKLGCKLPSVSNVKRTTNHIRLAPGINKCLFSHLKDAISQLKDTEKDCALLWGEMSIKKLLQYNKTTNEFEGNVDNGRIRTLELANKALVFMIRGVNANWKFPISYYFSNHSITPDILSEILFDNINEVFNIGLKVRVCVCHLSPRNQKLYKLCGICARKPFIRFQESEIYMIYDSAHLMKLVQNNLMNRNFVSRSKKIKWIDIINFWRKDRNSGERLAPKLSNVHFDVEDVSKMKVSLVTQVFSGSVYSGMMSMVGLGLLKKEVIPTANFVKDMDEMFDMMNISKHSDIKSSRSGCTFFDRLHRFDYFINRIKGIRVQGCGRRPDCFDGLHLTLTGLKSLAVELYESGYKFVSTRGIQQDCLERCFSFIRSKGGRSSKTTAFQFKCSFRYLFFLHLVRKDNGNCDDTDESDTLF